MSKQSILSRRNFLKIGSGLLAATFTSRLLPKTVGSSGEVALASGLMSSPENPDIHLVGTDGWIYLPGQVPIPGTIGQYYNPDSWAPEGLTTYMFGFANVTGLTPTQIQARKMKAQASAPVFWVDQNQEYFVRLGNLGLQMRPDLVDSHTLHWHGFRNAWPVFDGEPHSSLAVPIGETLSLYYKPYDPGTYMYHCHFEETEHVHMGMTGAVFVRPAQNGNTALYPSGKFAYNDADGSTGYDREYVINLTDVWAEAHWDDAHIQLPDWTSFRADYFLMNGRVYPDTLAPIGGGVGPDGDLVPPGGRPELQYQPISSLIQCNSGDRVLLRFINLTFVNQTMMTPGLKMKVVGKDATILRGIDGTNLFYDTNAVFFGAGQSIDAIFTAPAVTAPTRYLLYNRNLNRLYNPGMPGLGGQATEIWVHPSGIPAQTVPNT